MDNELIKEASWGRRNRKWIIPLSLLVIAIGVLITLFSGKGAGDMAKVYAQPALYRDTLKQTKDNKKVVELLGTIQPIGKMAILEGYSSFSKNDSLVNLTIPLEGSKAGENGR